MDGIKDEDVFNDIGGVRYLAANDDGEFDKDNDNDNDNNKKATDNLRNAKVVMKLRANQRRIRPSM